MTVRDLIDKLAVWPYDMEVVIMYNPKFVGARIDHDIALQTLPIDENDRIVGDQVPTDYPRIMVLR
jgi:hypothetical protein